MGEDDYEKYDKKKKPQAKKTKKAVKKPVSNKKIDSNVLEEIDEDAVPSFIT